MRVINDKEEESRPTELGFLSLLAHAFLVALGMATILFGPMPVILAHLRLSNPWPKLAAVLGAVLALVLFEMSPVAVVILFAFSLYVADGVDQRRNFWKLLGGATLIAGGLGAASLVASAAVNHLQLLPWWKQLVGSFISQVQATIHVDKGFQWDQIRALLLYEGPFLYLSLAMLSVWFSLGLAAHLNWFSEDHPFSANNLRQIVIPKWASFLFLALFLGTLFTASKIQFFLGGAFRLFGTVMFIQGCIALSNIFERRGLRKGMRGFIYLLGVVLGFYAIAGMGAISPWFFGQRRKGQSF